MGITYNIQEEKFDFDFCHDDRKDIIHLVGSGYDVEAFGKCFYYGYEFTDEVEGSLRSEFIKYLKFTPNLQQEKNLTQFIQKAINDLSRKVNLYHYDLVIMPESSSKVNQYMLRYLYRFAQPSMQKMELVKSLPSRITFDMEEYESQYLNDVLENGRPRYTETQKAEAKQRINEMMELIHNKDYFTIAKDVKKSKFRPYIQRFLTFASPKDELLYSKINEQNVLVVDDVTTSGSTLNEILRAIRTINDTNNITIFSLLGRKDLMAES
ncbi:MAG: hypothetical protein KBT39_02795 [Bacteroidales bacterium]|nr:hypothetical protein [Bacteroidales bacterium]